MTDKAASPVPSDHTVAAAYRTACLMVGLPADCDIETFVRHHRANAGLTATMNERCRWLDVVSREVVDTAVSARCCHDEHSLREVRSHPSHTPTRGRSMIRVVIRHIDDTDAVLVGDFPPDQIDELIARIRKTPKYQIGSSDGYCQIAVDPVDDPTQFVVTDGASPRLVFEIVVEDA